MIVAVSVLTGARFLGGADDTARVWAVARDMEEGEVLAADDLVVQDIRFPSEQVADRYLPATADVAELTLARALGKGELLPRGAVAEAAREPLLEVPVVAPAESVPATVDVGSVVDVWTTSRAPDGEAAAEARLVLDDVPVVAVPGASGGLAPATTRQLIVGLDEEGQDGLAGALAQLSSGRTTVVRQR